MLTHAMHDGITSRSIVHLASVVICNDGLVILYYGLLYILSLALMVFRRLLCVVQEKTVNDAFKFVFILIGNLGYS